MIFNNDRLTDSQVRRVARCGVALAATALMAVSCFSATGAESPALQIIDLDGQGDRQVVVDREEGQYLGHPTTVLLEDNKTMLCVYPKGHGRGAIVYKRSDDAGLTWSDRLPTPDSWATSQEVPTLHRVVDAVGKKRIIMFSGLHPVRMAVTEDDGKNWSELKSVGDWGGIVTMGCVEQLKTGAGHYMALFHDDGRFFRKEGKRRDPRLMTLYKTFSTDGGLTWSFPEVIDASTEHHICEPGIIRSPDGKQLAVFLRENSRRHNSQIMFSEDEGKTWSRHRDLPDALNGDRHTAKYTPDGRIFISFRSRSPKGKTAPFEGDWAGWVGTYDDLVHGRPGQYHVRLKDNHRGADCAYPGVEVLPDGTVVTTTYGHWDKGKQPYILSVRFKLSELDALVDRPAEGAADRAHQPRPNVLFIAVDDLNDWVGCLGHGQALTPNIDRLAERGMLFTNAHCTAPVCNPSRVAVLSGLRPDTTGVYENNHIMRRKLPELVTLPAYFRQQGYQSHGGGKIFHDVPPHCADEASWDNYFWWNEHGAKGSRAGNGWRSPYSVPPDPQPNGRPTRQITPITKRNFDWGPVDRPETDWPDRQVADWAAEFLAGDHKKPFFLAIGIFRPHVPWFNPCKYFDQYAIKTLQLPAVKDDDVDDLGKWARKRALDAASKHAQLIEYGEWKSAVRAYLASISHADAMVGRVLDALDASRHRADTIIVLWSDHGYHLGEKGHWHKRTLWERSTHVPLIIVARGVTEPAVRCERPVNLLDLYPTLVELCGLSPRPELEGHSLVPLLKSPKADWEYPSITTYLPGNHAIRSQRWRYIRYRSGEEELYDHENDPNEWRNLAMDSKYAGVIARHEEWLPATAADSK